MKPILSVLSLFVLPTILFFAWNRELGTIPSSYLQKRQFFDKFSGRVEVLVMGASGSLEGVDPTYFSAPGFNLANNAQDFGTDLDIAMWAILRLPKLKVIIFPVDIDQLITPFPMDRAVFYHDLYDVPYPTQSIFNFIRFNYSVIYDLSTAWEGLHGVDVNSVETITENGWQRQESKTLDEPDRDDPSALPRSREYMARRQGARFQEMMAKARKVIPEIQAKNVKVALFACPNYERRWKSFDPAAVQAWEDDVNKLASDTLVSFHNYLKDERFKLDDFSDYVHVNAGGAKKLSGIIDDEIVKKLIPNP